MSQRLISPWDRATYDSRTEPSRFREATVNTDRDRATTRLHKAICERAALAVYVFAAALIYTAFINDFLMSGWAIASRLIMAVAVVVATAGWRTGRIKYAVIALAMSAVAGIVLALGA